MPTTYYLSAIDSDLSGGWSINKKLLPSTESASTAILSARKSKTEESYAFTEPNIPSTGGTTGDYSIEINVTVGSTDIYLSVSVSRINSLGAVQSTSSTTSEQQATAGVKTFNLSSVDLGTWASGDRLRVNYYHRNANTKDTVVITIQTGTTNTEHVTPWSAGAALVEDVSSTVGITEALAKLLTLLRADADVVGITEAVYRAFEYNRPAPDSVGISETTARPRVMNREDADAVSIAETIDRFAELVRAKGDSITIGEAVAHLLSMFRSIDETVDVSEVVDRILGFVRSSDDAVGISETIERILGAVRDIAEGVGITESIARVRDLVRAKAENVAIVEAVSRVFDYVRSIETTLAIAETISRRMEMTRENGTTVTVAEAVDRLLAMTREEGSTVSIAETTAKVLGMVDSLSDGVAITETLSSILGFVKEIASTVGISETVYRREFLNRRFDSTVSIAETIATHLVSLGLFKTIDEGISVDEIVARVFAYNRTATSTIAIDEAVEYIRGFIRPADDSVDISETVAGELFGHLVKSIDDSVGVTEGNDYAGDCDYGTEADQATVTVLDLPVRASKPPKPGTGKARLYSYLDGGKVQLRIVYPGGADQLIDGEP
jgi:hypothetical protein